MRTGQPANDGGTILWRNLDLPSGRPKRGSHQVVTRYIKQGEICLDVGMGTGTLASEIRASGGKVLGLDVDPRAVERAVTEGFPAVVGSAQNLPIRSRAPVDVAILSDVLEHLLDPAKALKELARVLSPRGRLILSVPNIAYWRVRLRIMRGRFDYTERGTCDYTHLRFFTLKTLVKMLDEAGFKMMCLDVVAGNMGERGPLRNSVSLSLAKTFPKVFAYQLVLVAKPVN